jgi:hypothetical protein
LIWATLGRQFTEFGHLGPIIIRPRQKDVEIVKQRKNLVAQRRNKKTQLLSFIYTIVRGKLEGYSIWNNIIFSIEGTSLLSTSFYKLTESDWHQKILLEIIGNDISEAMPNVYLTSSNVCNLIQPVINY